MNKEEAAALIELLQAYVEGKTIQHKYLCCSYSAGTGVHEAWQDCANFNVDVKICDYDSSTEDYRVKPETDLRSMTLKEVFNWWQREDVVLFEGTYCKVVNIDMREDCEFPITLVEIDEESYPQLERLTLKGFINTCLKADNSKFEVAK